MVVSPPFDKDLQESIKGDPEYAAKDKLLQSVCGVGFVVSATLNADLPELETLNAKKISTLVGVAPLNRDSGGIIGKRCVWGGRATVRAPLYMATLSAIKRDPAIKIFYERLRKAAKAAKVALLRSL